MNMMYVYSVSGLTLLSRSVGCRRWTGLEHAVGVRVASTAGGHTRGHAPVCVTVNVIGKVATMSAAAVHADVAATLARRTKIGDVDGVRHMLDMGVGVDTRDERGNTPLIHAAWHNHLNILTMLLERGADPNVSGACGTQDLTGC